MEKRGLCRNPLRTVKANLSARHAFFTALRDARRALRTSSRRAATITASNEVFTKRCDAPSPISPCWSATRRKGRFLTLESLVQHGLRP